MEKELSNLDLFKCFEEKRFEKGCRDESSPNLSKYIDTLSGVVLKPWIGSLGEDINLLDIGCGDGRYAQSIATDVKKYIGLDIRESILDFAMELNASNENVEFTLGNGLDLSSIPSGSVGAVFSYQSFLHMPSKHIISGYLKEVERVLSEQGEAKIQFCSPSLSNNLRIDWRRVSSLLLKDKKSILRSIALTIFAIFPIDFSVPILKFNKADNHWGRFGKSLSLKELYKLCDSLGLFVRLKPSFYSGYLGSSADNFYWVYLRKNQNFSMECLVN